MTNVILLSTLILGGFLDKKKKHEHLGSEIHSYLLKIIPQQSFAIKYPLLNS